jgi:hypothetical protein
MRVAGACGRGAAADAAAVALVLKSTGAALLPDVALVVTVPSGGVPGTGEELVAAGAAPAGSLIVRSGAAAAANNPTGASTAECGVAASVAVSVDGGAAARGAVVVVGAGSSGFGAGRALPSASGRGAGSREDVWRAVEALLGMARTHHWRGIRAACGCGDRQFMAES